jgi:hypothetical protein
VCGALLAGLAFVVSPWAIVVCPVRLLLHVPCPSCGLTRAASCVLHADLAGATRIHPLWWAVFPYLGILVALEAVTYVRTGKTGRWAQHPLVTRLGAALLVALIVVWGARAFGAFGGPVPI